MTRVRGARLGWLAAAMGIVGTLDRHSCGGRWLPPSRQEPVEVEVRPAED
jgi:hypothetical protein